MNTENAHMAKKSKSGVEEAFQHMDQAVEGLDRVVLSLTTSLAVALTPDMHDDSSESVSPPKTASAVANEIERQADRIQELSFVLNRILDRVDL